MNDVDEVIHLAEYDPQWPSLFAAEAQRIASRLDLGVTTEHIGSTAVPCLAAKPVIDIMIGTESENVEPIRTTLIELGYQDIGEAGVPGRVYLRRRIGIAFNIALVQRGSPIWLANLALRDHLRTSAAARREYAEVKRHAFDSGIQSLLAYSDFKSAVLSRLIRQALEENR
jgi:GrpB-like predicted nucleotidyltransferase (UPF0157 family)